MVGLLGANMREMAARKRCGGVLHPLPPSSCSSSLRLSPRPGVCHPNTVFLLTSGRPSRTPHSPRTHGGVWGDFPGTRAESDPIPSANPPAQHKPAEPGEERAKSHTNSPQEQGGDSQQAQSDTQTWSWGHCAASKPGRTAGGSCYNFHP